jgi:dipeptidyl-peptidase 4
LIQALQNAGKSFEVQVGPDKGHTAVNRDRMMEFFIQHLVLNQKGYLNLKSMDKN